MHIKLKGGGVVDSSPAAQNVIVLLRSIFSDAMATNKPNK